MLVAMNLLASGCALFEQRVPGDEDRPYGVSITTRDHWPEGYPLRVRFMYTGPTFWHASMQAIATPQFDGGASVSDYHVNAFIWVHWSPEWLFSDRTEAVGTPPEPMDGVAFDAKIIRADTGLRLPRWRETLVVPVRVGGTIDDVLTPVRDPEIDRLLAEASALQIHPVHPSVWDASDRWHLDLSNLARELQAYEGLTFAVSVEVRRDGAPVLTGSGWWDISVSKYSFQPAALMSISGNLQGQDRIILKGEVLTPTDFTSDDCEWTLRMQSNPEMALRNFDSAHYWDGEIEIPLRVVEHPATSSWLKANSVRSCVSPFQRADRGGCEAVTREP